MGVYVWPHNRLGRGSERPTAQTQEKLTQVPSPPPPGSSNKKLLHFTIALERGTDYNIELTSHISTKVFSFSVPKPNVVQFQPTRHFSKALTKPV